LSIEEPVVSLRPSEVMPIVEPRGRESSGNTSAPLFIDGETSQPIVTVERFPDAELQNDLQAELEAELSQVLGPLVEARPAPASNEADFLDVSVELDLDRPSELRRPITGTKIPSVEALLPASRTPRPNEPADEAGDLSAVSPIHVLYKLAVEKTSGLLVVE